MKFNTKQFLSVLLTLNLVWIFVGCAFLCAENDYCTEDVEVSSNNFANFDEPSHEDSCPIKTSARMTTPERIVLKFKSAIVNSKDFTNFLVTAILPVTFKYQPKFYPPPNITSQNKRQFILRI
ncbi:MAG: hypothetical protein ACR2MD_06960 [Aridibacter sp.]